MHEEYSEHIDGIEKPAEAIRTVNAEASTGALGTANTFSGESAKTKIKTAERLFSSVAEAAEQGSADAAYKLGYMYEHGLIGRPDDEKAFKWYCRAAGKGLAVAQYNLGCMLRNGHGVQKNSREAEAWFREAAQQGYTDARLMLRAISYDRRIHEAQSYWEETPISSWDEPSQDDGLPRTSPRMGNRQ